MLYFKTAKIRMISSGGVAQFAALMPVLGIICRCVLWKDTQGMTFLYLYILYNMNNFFFFFNIEVHAS